jgi:hypothetical protein
MMDGAGRGGQRGDELRRLPRNGRSQYRSLEPRFQVAGSARLRTSRRLDRLSIPPDKPHVKLEPQMTQIYTAAVTLAALPVHFALSVNVGRARTRYGIKAPAVTGNENFERAYRVQMNTLEQLA